MIISMLGKAGEHNGKKTTARYEDSESGGFIQSGTYINSTDALLQNYPNADFVLLGTKDSIDLQRKLLNFKNSVQTQEYDESHTEKMFNTISQLLHRCNDEIIFDITHSFRDAAMMSLLSVIISRFSSKKKIEIVFAKEIVQHKSYRYTKLNEFLDISTLSFLISSFRQTYNVPDIGIGSSLYDTMKEFCADLHSNQINELLKHSLPKLQDEINSAKESLFTISFLIEELQEELVPFQKLKNEPIYLQYFHLATMMFEKNYHFATYAYLFESIPEYIFYHLQKRGFFVGVALDYDRSKKVVTIINPEKLCIDLLPQKDLIFQSKAFVAPLFTLFKRIKEGRNDLAHIHKEKGYSTNELENILNEYESIVIQQDPLKDLESYAKYQEKTTKKKKKVEKLTDEKRVKIHQTKEFRQLRTRYFQHLGLDSYNPTVLEEIKSENFFYTPKKLRDILITRKNEDELFHEVLNLHANKNDLASKRLQEIFQTALAR